MLILQKGFHFLHAQPELACQLSLAALIQDPDPQRLHLPAFEDHCKGHPSFREHIYHPTRGHGYQGKGRAETPSKS